MKSLTRLAVLFSVFLYYSPKLQWASIQYFRAIVGFQYAAAILQPLEDEVWLHNERQNDVRQNNATVLPTVPLTITDRSGLHNIDLSKPFIIRGLAKVRLDVKQYHPIYDSIVATPTCCANHQSERYFILHGRGA